MKNKVSLPDPYCMLPTLQMGSSCLPCKKKDFHNNSNWMKYGITSNRYMSEIMLGTISSKCLNAACWYDGSQGILKSLSSHKENQSEFIFWKNLFPHI